MLGGGRGGLSGLQQQRGSANTILRSHQVRVGGGGRFNDPKCLLMTTSHSPSLLRPGFQQPGASGVGGGASRGSTRGQQGGKSANKL